jgi:predicted metalloprotease with PDZ domain
MLRRASLVVALAVSLVFGLLLAGAVARQGTGQDEIRYRLSVPEPSARWLQVEAIFPALGEPLDLHMSRASPGRYSTHELARNVFALEATDGAGRPLVVEPLTPSQWRIAGHDGTVRIKYHVFGDRVDGTYLAVDPTHAHLNMPATLVWARGLELRPARVTIAPPAGSNWRVATQLFSTSDPFVFTAPNLQYLMDSPIEASRFEWRTFTPEPIGAGSAPTIAVAVHGAAPDDVDRFVADLRRIVSVEGRVFGEYPQYEGGRYTFLADTLPWATGDGMEHRNSTVLTTTAGAAAGPGSLLDIAAHEFIHGWNVERIRPLSLEPFDFDRGNMSGELWLAEGVTSYYAALASRRAGLSSTAELLHSIGRLVDDVVTSPARGLRSAADMSRMAPLVDGAPPTERTNLNLTYVSYYTYGAVLGLGFDLAIREHTGGTRSLDDFMRAMWRVHGRPGGARPGYVGRPYTPADVIDRLAEASGDRAFAEHLIRAYVQGRELPDFASLLSRAGILMRQRDARRATLGLVGFKGSSDGLRVGGPVPDGSPIASAGLGEDDRLLAIDGREVPDVSALERVLSRHTPGDAVTLRVQGRSEAAPREIRVTLVPDPHIELVTIEDAGGRLDEAQRAFREAWLGAK